MQICSYLTFLFYDGYRELLFFGHIVLTINKTSYIRFWLAPIAMTLNNLEHHNRGFYWFLRFWFLRASGAEMTEKGDQDVDLRMKLRH